MSKINSLASLQKIHHNDAALFFILGPCAIENEKHTLTVASYLKNLSEKLGFTLIFKSSFDKANRTSHRSYRSVGMKEGCRILSRVSEEFDVPVISDIHEVWQADEVAPYVDIIQIPAMLCRQTDLLVAAGKTKKIINIKKGQFATVQVMDNAAKKVREESASPIWLCERGFSFGYGDLIVDYRNFPWMKQLGHPIVFDVTHAVQRPNELGTSTGGDRTRVADLAIAAVSQGIAGLFMEVHEEPERALCDGPNSMRLSQLENLISYLMELDAWVKSKPRPEVF